MSNIPGFLATKNALHVANWRWHWHLQGGGFHWRARDLVDMRDDHFLRMWRRTEVRLREARRQKVARKNVANLAKLRFERARRKA